MIQERKGFAHSITHTAICVALLTVCSWIAVPFFVNFTMQTFAVFLICALSSSKQGLAAILCYITLGFMGIPVFSGFQAGIGVLLGPSGGYLIGFILMPLICGLFTHLFEKTKKILFLSLTVSLLLCYLCGLLWYILIYGQNGNTVSWLAAVFYCVVPFVVPDFLKLLFAITLAKRINFHIHGHELT